VGGCLALAERGSKRNEAVAPLLAAVLVVMWIGVIAFIAWDRMGLFAVD